MNCFCEYDGACCLFICERNSCLKYQSWSLVCISCSLQGSQCIGYLQDCVGWGKCWVCEISGPKFRDYLRGFDSAVNLTYLSDEYLSGTMALDCQSVISTTHAPWSEWLSDPGLSLFSDPATCLSLPAQRVLLLFLEKKHPFTISSLGGWVCDIDKKAILKAIAAFNVVADQCTFRVCVCCIDFIWRWTTKLDCQLVAGHKSHLLHVSGWTMDQMK